MGEQVLHSILKYCFATSFQVTSERTERFTLSLQLVDLLTANVPTYQPTGSSCLLFTCVGKLYLIEKCYLL